MEILNLKTLDDVMVTEEYRVKISSRFVAFEYLDVSKYTEFMKALDRIGIYQTQPKKVPLLRIKAT
jgi:hypothetical protein